MADDILGDERKEYVDAARESARTFDKAVLTFGSAVFGFSIAFLKDIAPTPARETLKWLGASWLLFSLGETGTGTIFPIYRRHSFRRPPLGIRDWELGSCNHPRR
jgi:hypothetical protein